ncbi:MAG: hypothetical protein ABI769_13835 [Pseudomonadota bacterium]
MLAILPLTALAADDLRVATLEMEIRDLRREVQVLSRRLDGQRPLPARPDATPPVAATAASLPQWVDASKWRQLRRGMSELEVIGSLGAPTSMREEGGARVLFYALEIGSSGFLGGSVKLRERAVVEVRQPTLQ